MEDKLDNLLSFCSKIDFGIVDLSQREKDFRRKLNKEILLLCESLPKSTQPDALFFILRCLEIPLAQKINFLGYYYVPTWSIIYWLSQSCPHDKGLEPEDIKHTITAHTMALFLHSLDDHLKDDELPTTHLALLLRSQAWMIMNNAFNCLSEGVDGGDEIVRTFIDDYYSGIRSSKEIESLDVYCDLFRKQMATGFIAPLLMSKKITSREDFAGGIRNAYGSFGIAWRLLDDIKDIETDMMKGAHSSIYVCLPENIKSHWDKNTEDKNGNYAKVILEYVLENGVIDKLKERLCDELESAVYIADEYNVGGFANEFRCLLNPLKNRKYPL